MISPSYTYELCRCDYLYDNGIIEDLMADERQRIRDE